MATYEKWAKLFKARHQYMDSIPIQFGDAKDAALTWDGTNLTLKPVTDDTGAFVIGDGTTDMDFKVFMNTSAKYVLFDQSAFAVTFVGTTLTLGADTTGTDFKLFGATTGNYLLWDASEDDLTLVGTATQLAVAGTTAASSATTGSIHTAGGVGIAGALWVGTTSRLVGAITADAALGIVGAITVSPAATGTFLDFALETEWISGTLINADFGSSTTLTGAVVGINLDFGANVVATSEQSVKGLDINLPQMTVDAASPTVKGIEISATGATVQTTSGTTTWTGIDITMPAQTQTAGTVTATGIKVTTGAITSGTHTGLQLGVDDTGVDAIFYGATTGNYLHWDESADDLLLVGTATQLAVAGTTASSSTTTGSLRTAGGLGVAGAAYIGGLLDVTLASINATTGRIAKFTGTVLTPNFGDGYGALEVQLNIGTGAVAGYTAAQSIWVNLAAATTYAGGSLVTPLDVGIWGPSGTFTNSKMIMGLKMSYVIDDGTNPGSLYLFSTNIFSNVLTALFDVNAIVDMGGSTGAQTGNDYKVPLFRDNSAGQLWYVNIYHT